MRDSERWLRLLRLLDWTAGMGTVAVCMLPNLVLWLVMGWAEAEINNPPTPAESAQHEFGV